MKTDISRSTFRREKHYSSVRMQQGRVQLDADWNEQRDIQAHLDRTAHKDLMGFCGAPATEGGFEVQAPSEGGLTISQGRLYVQGILCENEEDVPFTDQPDLPGFELPVFDGEAGARRVYLVYMDVWERNITVLEDPGIREVALGGADTTTRTKIVWQVKLEEFGESAGAETCWSLGPEWVPKDAQRTRGLLRCQAEVPSNREGDPCVLAPDSGYRGLENQLYRVEIHDRGVLGEDAEVQSPTFKWSRDNGSVAARLAQPIEGKTLSLLETPGATYAPGNWVELSDNTHELLGLPGLMVQVAAVEGTEVTVTEWPGDTTPEIDLASAIVRRWDSPGAVPLASGSLLELEDGVQVEFHEGDYRTGDYWTIPARTTLGDVVWPTNEEGAPFYEEPHGIEHFYTALALVELDETGWRVMHDCRRVFVPVTESKEEAGIHINAVQSADNSPVSHDSDLTVERLIQGLHVECDHDIDAVTVEGKPTCTLSLNLPYPMAPSERQLWGNAVVGHQAVIVAADVSVDRSVIVWKPQAQAAEWLQRRLFPKMVELGVGERVLGRLRLQGNFIWKEGEPNLFLDGDVLGTRREGAAGLDLRFPSGDRRRGGDFEMWFWLVAGTRPAPRIAVNPRSLAFGMVGLGGTGSANLAVQNPGSIRLEVSRVAINNNQFSVTGTGRLNVEPGAQSVLRVRFTPRSAGIQIAQLTLNSNDPSTPVLHVRLVGIGQAVPNISVPGSLNLGNIPVGRPTSRALTVRNVGTGNLRVTRVTVDNGLFRVSPNRFVVRPNAHANVTISIVPRRVGVVPGKLSIESNDPDKAKVEVNLRANGVRSRPSTPPVVKATPVRPVVKVVLRPNIRVEPNRLDFGNRKVGQPFTRGLTVRNTGTSRLFVSKVSSSSSSFQVRIGAFRVDPGKTRGVPVQFTAGAKGPKAGTITITSNDPDSRIVRVTVRGRGI